STGNIARILSDGSSRYLRKIGRQQIGAAQTIEVNIGDAVASPHHGLVQQVVRKSEPRREIVIVRMDEAALKKRAIPGLDDRIRCRIVVRLAILVFVQRSRKLIAHPKIQGQPRIDLEVILYVREMQALAQVNDKQVCKLVLGSRAKHEVSQIIQVIGNRSPRTAELAAVCVQSH